MLRQFVIALRMTTVLTVLTGLAYPDVVTGLAESLYPWQAAGSLIWKDGKAIGSVLIGQNFTRPEYFHPRPSAVRYDASYSGGSSLGPTNQALIQRIREDLERFYRENPDYSGRVPADLLTTSASGLDPHISPASALAQAPHVARTRGVPVRQVEELIREWIEPRDLGILGEPRVNVLALNLALDQRFPLPVPREK
jgi:K+-transporting ATPase ATPase C chain